jgi:hypothetical protein
MYNIETGLYFSHPYIQRSLGPRGSVLHRLELGQLRLAVGTYIQHCVK